MENINTIKRCLYKWLYNLAKKVCSRNSLYGTFNINYVGIKSQLSITGIDIDKRFSPKAIDYLKKYPNQI